MDDHSKIDNRPIKDITLWACATDKFMSGWGQAPKFSYVAYPCTGLTSKQQNNLLAWMEKRGDFIRVRLNNNLPKVQKGSHLSVYDVPEEITE